MNHDDKIHTHQVCSCQWNILRIHKFRATTYYAVESHELDSKTTLLNLFPRLHLDSNSYLLFPRFLLYYYKSFKNVAIMR